LKLTDIIEQCLLDMLKTEQAVTLQRNELAERFSCAPSQINYVIDTRFTGQRGYIIESRRGGGGYIRIRKVEADGGSYLMHVVGAIGDSIDHSTVLAMLSNMLIAEIITERELNIISAALADKAILLNQPQRDMQRAAVFKNILLEIV